MYPGDEDQQTSMYDTSPSLKRPANVLEQNDASTPKRTRGRSGCLNCRRRRKKCDEAKPDCSKCRSRGEDCEWDTGITFRLSGLDPQHPSMLQARTSKSVVSQNGLRIVDVQFHTKASSSPSNKAESNRQDQVRPSPSLPILDPGVTSYGDTTTTGTACRRSSDVFNADATESGMLCTIPEEPCQPAGACDSSRPSCQVFPYEQANPADMVNDLDGGLAVPDPMFEEDDDMPEYPRSNSDSSASVPSFPWSTGLSASSVTSVSSQSSKNAQVRQDGWNDGLTHLDSLDCLIERRSPQSLLAATTVVSNGDTACTTAPESPKQKLQHQIQELVHKITLAHQTSSDTDADDSTMALRDLRLNENKFKGVRLVQSPIIARPLGCTKLVKRRQLELWRNYIDEIAPSLDACGGKRYFQQTLPMLAKSADHLHYAVLALSSRHMENRESEGSHSESNSLCQDAIAFLLPELHTLDIPSVATCLLLCIIDLLICPPSQCTDSLRTCAALMDAADINARSGGFRQALFWCLANFAVWHNLSHPDSMSSISTRSFYPTDSLTNAVNYIRSLTLGDGHAKYVIYLTSAIMDIVSTSDSTSTSCKDRAQTQAQLSALSNLLADWFNCRPEEMQPLMSYPSILDDEHHPFPMVLYPTVPAAIGNLLYHCASILLQQQDPQNAGGMKSCANRSSSSCQELPSSVKSSKNNTTKCSPPETATGKGVTWHARQICGILSESHDAPVLLHGRHALDIAGTVIGHTSEKEAVLVLLDRIEQETGWGMRLRTEEATVWR